MVWSEDRDGSPASGSAASPEKPPRRTPLPRRAGAGGGHLGALMFGPACAAMTCRSGRRAHATVGPRTRCTRGHAMSTVVPLLLAVCYAGCCLPALGTERHHREGGGGGRRARAGAHCAGGGWLLPTVAFGQGVATAGWALVACARPGGTGWVLLLMLARRCWRPASRSLDPDPVLGQASPVPNRAKVTKCPPGSRTPISSAP